MPTVLFSHNKGTSLIFSRETKCLKPSQLAHPWRPLPTYEREPFTDQTLFKSICNTRSQRIQKKKKKRVFV
jgi:hypothetical protein